MGIFTVLLMLIRVTKLYSCFIYHRATIGWLQSHSLTRSLCPREKDSTKYPLTETIRLSGVVIKESHWLLFRGPSPNTSAVAWQGPLRHPKGTTVVKINLAASLQRPAAENERGREIEKGRRGLYQTRAGIPILANCFVGRLPKLGCEKGPWTKGKKEITLCSSWSCRVSHFPHCSIYIDTAARQWWCDYYNSV